MTAGRWVREVVVVVGWEEIESAWETEQRHDVEVLGGNGDQPKAEDAIAAIAPIKATHAHFLGFVALLPLI